MAGLGAWIWGTSQLDDAIDRATSELLPSGSEDIALNLEICDQIRSKSAPARDAMRAIKRRLNHKNPNVQLLALSLSDVCVKNGGDLFLAEVASREFMDNLESILKIPTLNQDVKNLILRLIQNWSVAFEGKPILSYTGQVYERLKKDGYKFPPKDLVVANSAMIDTQTAPEWSDSDLCLGCRTAFTFTNRKHHCRNCGQVFDQACSSKTLPLPHYGITQEVRVCDGCFKKLTRKAESSKPPPKKDQQQRRSHRPHGQELEDAELQRAIQASLQESKGYTPSQPAWQASEPPIVDRRTRPVAEDPEDDPELRAAIEASLREANAPRPSAPAQEPVSNYHHHASALPSPPIIPHYDLSTQEADTILTFNQHMEAAQAQGSSDLSRYPAVTELYDKANGLRPKLAMSLDDSGRKQEVLSDMHSKLSEAVKLYDQILTHQVSQPRYRTAAMAPAAPTYQPIGNAYHTGYNQQWSPQLQPQQTGPVQQQQIYSPPPVDQLTNQYSNLAISNEAQQPQCTIFHQRPPLQYASAPSAPQPPVSVASPPPAPEFASAPYMRQPPQQQQFSTLPPVTFGQHAPQSPPPQQVASPAPSVESQGGLTRHNTVAYASAPPASHDVGLGRSNTVGPGYQQQQQQQHAQQQQQQQQYHQQYQLQLQRQQQALQQQQIAEQRRQQEDMYRQQMLANAPHPPTANTAALAGLPAAPTGVPQYGVQSPYAASVEQEEERKEALLIDL
ncbi:vacuolar protein sorting-associated protein 27 [Ephemerocybe angulata]|uniref:Vacuolar protein sorting-associated protein 27 n=1 Tax=Ephemerocybe angulata TaxID=980116 RepID=A0A8H6HRA5_9AGAR|nr:vacuolar protein sorting-associated protein 27 [Tulosesus angulatus]